VTIKENGGTPCWITEIICMERKTSQLGSVMCI